MGKKGYRPKASLQLLKQLEERYWDIHVVKMLKDNGQVSRAHAEWNMYSSGCIKSYARQLVAWKARLGEIRLRRQNGTWVIYPVKADYLMSNADCDSASEGN